MNCLVCGRELLDAVAFTVKLGGPQVCGECIDSGKGYDFYHGKGTAMRELTFHKIKEPEKAAVEIRDTVRVFAADDTVDGINHSYQVSLWRHNQWQDFCKLTFQKGSPFTDEGANGLTNEALLAVVMDRLTEGCYYRAFMFCEAALDTLKQLTKRHVEQVTTGTAK